MFGIGFSEMVVIAVILVIVVGPERMPGMLKALVRGYREFRRATRELRASTGIDELLEDEDLRSLRKPLYVPPAKRPAPIATKPRSLSYAERMQENPPEGVDVAEARAAESRASAAETEGRQGTEHTGAKE
ncbi:MAG TPA: twin-arginine translocase TatA/TatE family subunit [Sandaracinaceae bacterium]